MRIAHLSDVHVLDLTGVRAWRYLNKRLTGLANVIGSRRNAHPVHIFEAAIASLRADPVDHVVITGDLSNLALESEFERARALIAPLGGYDRLSVIPGNHDIYTRGSARSKRFEAYFGELMWPDGAERTFPWFKDLGEVKLIGFNSAFPTAPLIAVGEVGPDQLRRLHALSAGGALAGGCAVALVHHNLHSRGWRKDRMHGLQDRDAVIAACAEAGVSVVLHGHTHKAHRFVRDGVTVIGCGSSTWSDPAPAHMARYNVYDVGDGALRSTQVRIYDPQRGAFAPPVTAA
ncbi:MAG: hypothetical protein CVU56_04440 [Deltaproteobacteria bacterium HGW-Deltaproteobacteria-14]|nr:MAG: hypothetical protein CVU56_04440 [Deltaproteobacteria bacterium HGW-Deltaproteobacteria-14]